MSSFVSRPPVRWLGGKWKLARWITSHFPPHTTYVEPYAGGANILFNKPPSEFEIINDLNSDVVNYFNVLRNRTDELVRAIELTPYSREIQQRSFEPTDDSLEKALRFYIRCYQSFQPGSGLNSDTSWRFQKSNARGKKVTDEWHSTRHLFEAALRLKMVQIEHGDAVEIIRRFDTGETLFYVDPPYVIDTRSGSNTVIYDHEMSDEQHIELAHILRNCAGMVVLSGYRCDLYDDLYHSWTRLDKTATTNAGGASVESLWLSPRVTAMESLPLWNMRAGGVKH